MLNINNYRGKHRLDNVRRVPYDEALSLHINAVDDEGNKYTTHAFANRNDWWCGATILTPTVINSLKKQGKLPLKEYA